MVKAEAMMEDIIMVIYEVEVYDKNNIGWIMIPPTVHILHIY